VADKKTTDTIIKQPNIGTSNTRKDDSKFNPYRTKIVWEDDCIRIYADSTIDASKIDYALTKFEPYIYFEDFPVDTIYKGTKAPIDYKGNPTASLYRTVITYGYKRDSLNFAGHYCLVGWMCGAPCQDGVIIDLINGKVYNIPNASQGYVYKKDSRMLIVNPPDSTGYAMHPLVRPEIWIWDEITKKFLEKKKKKFNKA